MIYGTPVIKTETDVTDRIGVRTLVLGLMWQPSSSKLSQLQIDAEQPNIPAVPGGLLLIGLQTRPFGGAFKTSWTFEGVNGNGKTVTFTRRGTSLDFGFEAGFSQIEIQKHPYFQKLLAGYGGFPDPSSGRVIWPQFMPTASASAVGLLPGQSNTPTVNPMFDYQDYFSLEGTYRYRYAELALPGNLYAQVGTVMATSQLPGGPPGWLPDSRNWLKAPPIYKARGLIFDITETYWLSGRGGWPAPIYGGAIAGAPASSQANNSGSNAAPTTVPQAASSPAQFGFDQVGLGAILGARGL